MDNLTKKEIDIIITTINYRYALLKTAANSERENKLLISFCEINDKLTAAKQSMRIL